VYLCVCDNTGANHTALVVPNAALQHKAERRLLLVLELDHLHLLEIYRQRPQRRPESKASAQCGCQTKEFARFKLERSATLTKKILLIVNTAPEHHSHTWFSTLVAAALTFRVTRPSAVVSTRVPSGKNSIFEPSGLYLSKKQQTRTIVKRRSDFYSTWSTL